MDFAEYHNSRIKLSLLIFIVIFVIIQIFSIILIRINSQSLSDIDGLVITRVPLLDKVTQIEIQSDVKPMDTFVLPPQSITGQIGQAELSSAIKAQEHYSYNMILFSQFLLSILGGVMSYFLSGVVLKTLIQNIDSQRSFLSFASHEIRTPLTRLMLLTEFEDSKNFSSIKEEIEGLENITDKYLSFLSSYDKMKKLQIKKEKINLNLLIEEVLTKYTNSLREQKIEIVKQYSNNLEIYTERQLLFGIIKNLVDNAIKYIGDEKVITIQTISSDDKFKVIIINSFKNTQKGYGVGTKIIKHFTSILNYIYSAKMESDRYIAILEGSLS